MQQWHAEGVAESSQRQARGGARLQLLLFTTSYFPSPLSPLPPLYCVPRPVCAPGALRQESAGVRRGCLTVPFEQASMWCRQAGVADEAANVAKPRQMLLGSAPLVLEFAQLTLPVPGAAREITAFSLLFAFWLFFELEPELSWRGAAASTPHKLRTPS